MWPVELTQAHFATLPGFLYCIVWLSTVRRVKSGQADELSLTLVPLPSGGYINFERSKHNKNVTVTQLCGIERSRNLCMELAKAGITTAVIAILIFIALISSLIGYLAKKTITPAQPPAPPAPPAAT